MAPKKATGGLATSDKDPKATLNEVGEQILAALESVVVSAQRALAEGPSGVSRESLVRPSNMMVGDVNPERQIQAKNAEERAALRSLRDEPAVARVDVDWDTEGGPSVQTIYFPRRWTGGLHVPGALFVSSYAALGQLAEYEAGEIATIEVNGQTRSGRILKQVHFAPTRKEGHWDALISNFGIVPWGDVLRVLGNVSLRAAVAAIVRDLEGPVSVEDVVGQIMREAADAASDRLRIRRTVVDRIALRDRPILDKFQGQVFRLPLDRQVILFGPPGSGKTTTLIKRLAQKRTPEALTEHERGLVAAAGDTFARPESWAMYSPAELLKQYLGDAFNQVGVPDAGNVRTWEKERHDLARNVLGILTSQSNSGRFQLEDMPDALIDPSSKGIAKLHDEFAAYAETNLLRRCNEALEELLKTNDEGVRRQARALQRTVGGDKIAIEDVLRLLDQSEGLQDESKRLSAEIGAELNKIANLLLNVNRTLLEEIAQALPSLRAEEPDNEDEEPDEESVAAAPAGARTQALNVLMISLRSWARAIAEGRRSVGGQSGRLLELIERRLPSDAPFATIGSKIATLARLRTVVRAPRTFVLGTPAMYARFRRSALREGRHFSADRTKPDLALGDRVTPDEVDVMLLVMLRNSRRLLQHERRRLNSATAHDWLERIKSRYLMQVFVDEATDLSAVQLACTAELAHPTLRSWFASGDLRQRITASGIQDVAEIGWLNRTAGINVEVRQIAIGYRQSHRLRELSDTLAQFLEPTTKVRTNPPRGDDIADGGSQPLLGEGLSGEALAQWLTDRIHEVEVNIGRLPSVAIFVDGDDKIDPLLAAAQPILAKRNIPIVGYKGGLVMGDAREVRIFDVRHIKGMEFEAVFFIGIDRLAERIPDLFLRFLYVGVTRAATYLGLACETTLPKQLESARSHFVTTGWSNA